MQRGAFWDASSNATGAKRVSTEGKKPDLGINDAAREVGGQKPFADALAEPGYIEGYLNRLVDEAARARQVALREISKERSAVFDAYFGVSDAVPTGSNDTTEPLFPAAVTAETTKPTRVPDTPPANIAEALLIWAPQWAAQIVDDSYRTIGETRSKVLDDYFGPK